MSEESSWESLCFAAVVVQSKHHWVEATATVWETVKLWGGSIWEPPKRIPLIVRWQSLHSHGLLNVLGAVVSLFKSEGCQPFQSKVQHLNKAGLFSGAGEEILMSDTIIELILSCYGTIVVGRRPKKPKTLTSDNLPTCTLGWAD